MPQRRANATWSGTLRDGEGTMALGSGEFEGAYSFASRFEDGTGTNPEELIGAAHAGCYSMALANALSEAGYDPQKVEAEATVTLDADTLEITTVELDVQGTVPDTDAETFRTFATDAKENCPVSKALAGVEITLSATLVD